MFKKIKLYKIYKRFIRDNETFLEKNLKLRRDYTNFLYTVVNIDPETVNKYYTENEKVSKPIINEYIKKVDTFFSKNNMSELVAIRTVKRIDDFNWKVEFGYSLFNSKKRANRQLIVSIISILTIISYILIF
jgi:hypothetical protein